MTGPGGRLAVIVVNYGSHALLAENLTAVQRSLRLSGHDGCAGAHIVVVDNAHSDAERAAVTALADTHGWHLLAQEHNVGFGAGTNAGVAAARELGARRFLLLNPDATIDAASVEALMRAVDTDPMTLAGPVIRTSGGALWSDGHDLYLADGTSRATRRRPPGVTDVVPWLTGACLMIGAELWDVTGGFADEYFLYWEDIDLSWRVQQAGGRVRVVREAEAIHDEGGTHRGGGRGHSPLFTYYNVRNRLLFAARNLQPDDRRRWVRGAPQAAWHVLMWSGRRAVIASPALARAAARGTRDGLALARRAPGAWSDGGVVRVLTSFPQPRPTTNPYIVMLKDSLEARPDVDVSTFTWRRALTGRFDVFHAHWPEILVDGHSPVKAAVRQVLFVLMMLRFRLLDTAIVRTVHNLELPDGISRRQRLLLRWFDRRTDLRIRINDSTHIEAGPVETILHGHYRDWFATLDQPDALPGQVAFVGLIRRYKAVDALIRAFRQTGPTGPARRLVVAGRPSSPELAQEMRDLARGDDRIRLRLEFLPDADLVRTVCESSLVVLPAPEMHNSGTVLMALSLGRPVLVPDNAVNRRLADEVGPGWVFTFVGTLTGAEIERALRATQRRARGCVPDLSGREWPSGAARHAQAYRRAARRLETSQARAENG